MTDTATNDKELSALEIEESHIFQEILAQSKEVAEILKDLKASARINKLKGKATHVDNKIQENQKTDYPSLNGTTKREISDIFYALHKDDLESVLGKENLETIKRFHKENGKCEYTRLGFPDEEDGVTYYDCNSLTHGEFIWIVNELVDGKKPKHGDKVLVTYNRVKDKEFGELTKRDVYIYEIGGKYKHCYQSYSPLKDNLKVEEVISITKSMQQKNQVSTNSDEKSK